MRSVVVVGLAFLFGCSPSPAPSVPTSSWIQLSESEMAKLNSGDFRLPQDSIAFWLKSEAPPVMALAGIECQVRVGYFNNPGGSFMIVSDVFPKKLTAIKSQVITDILVSHGAQRVAKIPFRYGPDGRTQIVYKPIQTIFPGKQAKGVVSVMMNFPTQKLAKEASRYIDGAYRLKFGQDKHTFTLLAERDETDTRNATFEGEQFIPLVARFKGKVDWTGSSGEVANAFDEVPSATTSSGN